MGLHNRTGSPTRTKDKKKTKWVETNWDSPDSTSSRPSTSPGECSSKQHHRLLLSHPHPNLSTHLLHVILFSSAVRFVVQRDVSNLTQQAFWSLDIGTPRVNTSLSS